MFYVCLKIRITKVAFPFLDKWDSLIKTLYLFLFLTQIIKMQLQNITNFLMFNYIYSGFEVCSLVLQFLKKT